MMRFPFCKVLFLVSGISITQGIGFVIKLVVKNKNAISEIFGSCSSKKLNQICVYQAFDFGRINSAI